MLTFQWQFEVVAFGFSKLEVSVMLNVLSSNYNNSPSDPISDFTGGFPSPFCGQNNSPSNTNNIYDRALHNAQLAT